MNDRELLEAAAKAAGIPGAYVKDKRVCWDEGAFKVTGIYVDGDEDIWNPLKDDGDAFRLAVRLQMKVDLYLGEINRTVGIDPADGDPCAAARRAIVIAAAVSRSSNDDGSGTDAGSA